MAKAAKKTKLTSLSEIYAFFRQNQTPITFLSPTPYNILGLGRWINKFEYINFFDCFDGTHPKITVPREHGPHEFKSIEDVNNYLLRHKEVRARLKERGPGLLMLVMFDEETEFLAGEYGLRRWLAAGGLERKHDGKRAALAGTARHRNRASHGFRQFARDRQPQACTAKQPFGIGIGLHELVENPARLVIRHADPGIADRNHQLAVFARSGRQGNTTLAGKLDGIAAQVEEDLPDALFIAKNELWQAMADMAGNLDRLGVGPRGEQLGDALDESDEIEAALLHIKVALLDLGDVEQFVDDRQKCAA